MTHSEFTPEILRLYRGFKAEDTLTSERMQALYDGLSHYPMACLRDAVTAALRDPKLPWFDKLHELVERESEADRDRERAENAGIDRAFMRNEMRPDADQPLARTHYDAIMLLQNGKRDAARQLLAAVGSPANLSVVTPRDGGRWLRANGRHWGLWPPSFLVQEQLDHIGWPWPEWPVRRLTVKMIAEAHRQLTEARERGILPADSSVQV